MLALVFLYLRLKRRSEEEGNDQTSDSGEPFAKLPTCRDSGSDSSSGSESGDVARASEDAYQEIDRERLLQQEVYLEKASVPKTPDLTNYQSVSLARKSVQRDVVRSEGAYHNVRSANRRSTGAVTKGAYHNVKKAREPPNEGAYHNVKQAREPPNEGAYHNVKQAREPPNEGTGHDE